MEERKPGKAPESDIVNLDNKSGVRFVHDDQLAAALSAVGIPFVKPVVVKRESANATVRETFLFAERNAEGDMITGKLIKAWVKWEDFVSRNPDHPFTFAICAAKNVQRAQELRANAAAYLSFKVPGKKSIVHVVKGSKRHEALVTRGFQQV